MRKLLAATALICMAATHANAQSPIPRPPGPPVALCTDLAIAGWNGSRSPPGAPLADNEVAIYFQVRNNGPLTYTAPDENKQWISLVVTMPSGDQQIGVNVLPPSGSGAVSLARGASWRGHVRATLPAGVTRTAHPPVRLQINYAPASAGWSPPADCNVANNQRSVVLR
jgi:hypothetical protein